MGLVLGVGPGASSGVGLGGARVGGASHRRLTRLTALVVANYEADVLVIVGWDVRITSTASATLPRHRSSFGFAAGSSPPTASSPPERPPKRHEPRGQRCHWECLLQPRRQAPALRARALWPAAQRGGDRGGLAALARGLPLRPHADWRRRIGLRRAVRQGGPRGVAPLREPHRHGQGVRTAAVGPVAAQLTAAARASLPGEYSHSRYIHCASAT